MVVNSFFQLNRILIAVEDGSCAEKAISYGFALANKLNAQIGIVHVSDLPAPIPFASDSMLKDPTLVMPELLDAQEEAAKVLLKDVIEKFSCGKEVVTFRRIGNAKDEILAAAAEWEADLLVLGTHGRTGLDHLIIGSVSESVSRHAKCPLLIVPNKK